jgi:hypothetical protein
MNNLGGAKNFGYNKTRMRDKILNFNVVDRKSFIEFLELPRKDFSINEKSRENQNLGEYLGAMARYTEDIRGFYDNTAQNINADEPSWKLFADLVKGATMYE